jgi:hypothetical protein
MNPVVAPNGNLAVLDWNRIWREARRRGLRGAMRLVMDSPGASYGRFYRVAWDGVPGIGDELIADYQLRFVQVIAG